MKIVEPTHKEIMQYLDCCFFGQYHKGQCQCHNRCQFKDCYEEAKERLTSHIYTEEEIRKQQEKNAKAMNEIDKALHELFD